MPSWLADGKVDWNDIQGIPPGFADGIDNVGSSRPPTPTPPTPTCDKSQGSTTRCNGNYEVTDYTDSDCSDERTYCPHGCSGGSCNSAPTPPTPPPIDTIGVCNNAIRNGCRSGTANDGAHPDTPTEYRWRCDGLNGGSNSGRCSKAKTVRICASSLYSSSDSFEVENYWANQKSYQVNVSGRVRVQWSVEPCASGFRGGRIDSKISVGNVQAGDIESRSSNFFCNPTTYSRDVDINGGDWIVWRARDFEGGNNYIRNFKIYGCIS